MNWVRYGLFKVLLILFTESWLVISIFGQKNGSSTDDVEIVKTKYTILEQDKKSFNSFFGSRSGEISFKLIELRNLNNNDSLFGVEVNIKTLESEVISNSIAFSNIGHLWGVSTGATYRNIRNQGFVFLNSIDLDTIVNFLNKIIGATSRMPNNFTMYRIALGSQFEFGMVYDPESFETNKWGFYITAEGSTYRLNYTDGISLLRSLAKFRKFIKDKEPPK